MPKTLPKETVEVIPLVVTVNGLPETDYEVAMIPFGTDLTGTDWHAPDVAGDKTGIMVSGRDEGRYWIFVRFVSAPEQIVRLLDYLILT